MLERSAAVLVVIDFQEKLPPKIPGAEAVVARASMLIQCADALGLPILWSEQYPKGLGCTTARIADLLEGHPRIEKMSFGCLGDAGFVKALGELKRKQLILVGVEAHVCVLQTALAAVEEGYDVFLAVDCVAARAGVEHRAALDRMARSGVHLVTAEMAVFELLREAGTPLFKQLLPLLKPHPAGSSDGGEGGCCPRTQ